MVVVLFLGGVQLMCIGVLGEYVGRMFDEAKGRPLYFLNSFEAAATQLGAESVQAAAIASRRTSAQPSRGVNSDLLDAASTRGQKPNHVRHG
jgi:polyisoprenyl-phosphate glycosyltransferase